MSKIAHKRTERTISMTLLITVSFFLFSFYARPDVSFNIRLLKAVQLMEFPLLRQWITQIVNEYLKFGNWNFVFAISHVPPFTSYVVLRLLRILQRDLV